jgi:hypothetical protein
VDFLSHLDVEGNTAPLHCRAGDNPSRMSRIRSCF